MDRKEQMKIWKEKERERKLKEDLLSDNFNISTLAKILLNKPIFQISKNEILQMNNSFELLQKIELKIIELAYKIKPTKIDLRGVEDEIVKTLPFPLQTVYFTNEFEASLSIGDANKEFYYEDNFEKLEKENYFNELARYYSEMQNSKMIELIEEGKKAKQEKDFDRICDKFEQLENQNNELKLNYIKNNITEFELK